MFDSYEIELYEYTATINQRRPNTPFMIGSISYPSKLVSCSNVLEIEKYQAFLELIKIRLTELNSTL